MYHCQIYQIHFSPRDIQSNFTKTSNNMLNNLHAKKLIRLPCVEMAYIMPFFFFFLIVHQKARFNIYQFTQFQHLRMEAT